MTGRGGNAAASIVERESIGVRAFRRSAAPVVLNIAAICLAASGLTLLVPDFSPRAGFLALKGSICGATVGVRILLSSNENFRRWRTTVAAELAGYLGRRP